MAKETRTKLRKKTFDRKKYLELNWEGSFDQYLELIYDNPKIVRTSFQVIYDMVVEPGVEKIEKYKKTLNKYKFFDICNPKVHGLEEAKHELVKFIKGAAGHYGPERRVCLMHGPVGSAKSTIARALKRGLEKYSQTENGKWYSYKWVKLPPEVSVAPEDMCPMHEEPLKLVPEEDRQAYLDDLNRIHLDKTPEDQRGDLYDLRCVGTLCPRCEKYMDLLLKMYDGDWDKVIENHIRVVRMVHSEKKRVGVGTFQPKDEKNQDSTELTGDINYQKIGHYGADSDPRAFEFSGELNVANRGIVEFIEMLKLDVAFLYDLLGASQEKQIKPKKFSQTDVDEFILCHSNLPDVKKLQNNEFMEALRDRTVKISIPYLKKWDDETAVLTDLFNNQTVRQHIAPHTLEIASFWAILTRLEDDEGKLTLVQKAELYNGQQIPGYTEDAIIQMMLRSPGEGIDTGISCRYVIDKVSNCLSEHHDGINPFMVLNELQGGLGNSALLNNKELIARYQTCIELAKKKLEKILTNEVQRAMVGDEEAIVRLCAQYIDNVRASNKKVLVKNPYTGEMEKPNERLMRDVERRIEISDNGAPDFRREIAAFIGDLAAEGKTFRWDSNQELKEALEAKLFDDIKDTIKLSAMSADGGRVVDPAEKEKLDALKARMIKWYGYNEKSATDVLNHVGSIFARGNDVEGNR